MKVNGEVDRTLGNAGTFLICALRHSSNDSNIQSKCSFEHNNSTITDISIRNKILAYVFRNYLQKRTAVLTITEFLARLQPNVYNFGCNCRMDCVGLYFTLT